MMKNKPIIKCKFIDLELLDERINLLKSKLEMDEYLGIRIDLVIVHSINNEILALEDMKRITKLKNKNMNLQERFNEPIPEGYAIEIMKVVDGKEK